MEFRESRPSPQALQPPINTRPIVQSVNTSWADPKGPQKTPQPSTGVPQPHPQPHTQPQASSPTQPQQQVQYPIQPSSYPMAGHSSPSQPSGGKSDAKIEIEPRDAEADASVLHARMQAELEERYREYQRSLWELQRSNIPDRTPGTPPGLYPELELTAGPSSGGGALG